MKQADVSSLRVLRRARDRIDRDYAYPIDIPALAAEAGYSREHFIRAFRAAYGETPVPLQPGGLVGGIADCRLDPRDAGHHRSQVAPVAEVAPVGEHPTAQADGAPDVQHATRLVAEAVDARSQWQAGGGGVHHPSPLHRGDRRQGLAATAGRVPGPFGSKGLRRRQRA